MELLNQDQIAVTKQYVFQNARLLDRQLFAYTFGDGTLQACLKALQAYQNADGGFGNGIEPDILCPDSSTIGAETALFILDLLEVHDSPILDTLVQWVDSNLNDAGYIPHPQQHMLEYPHQPWWENPDDMRILALLGYLHKLGVKNIPFTQKVRSYFESVEMQSVENYYSYPYFLYLKFCSDNAADRSKLAEMTAKLPLLLKQHADHFPLFSRAWYHAVSFLEPQVVEIEAQKFINAITEDGSLAAPYPQLPWWRPIWTVDGLCLLKHFNLI
jgi:hypothetical protein